MKKTKYILTAMTLFVSIFAFAQTKVGVKGIVIFADASTEVFIDNVNNAPKASAALGIGVFSEIPLNASFSFVPELQYIQKGFTLNEGFNTSVFGMGVPVGAKVTTRLNYLEAPLLLKGKINTGAVNLYAVAGPSFGYATSGTLQPKVTVLIDFNLPETDINLSNDIYDRKDIAGIIGGGAELPIGTGNLFADVRYQHSFTNIIKDPIADINISNKGVQLSVGYSYAF